MSDQVTAREVAERIVAEWLANGDEFFVGGLYKHERTSLIDAITAALAAAVAGAVPKGYVMVPAWPTDLMLSASRKALKNYIDALPEASRYPGSPSCNLKPALKAKLRYVAMIQAAPPIASAIRSPETAQAGEEK